MLAQAWSSPCRPRSRRQIAGWAGLMASSAFEGRRLRSRSLGGRGFRFSKGPLSLQELFNII